MKKILSVIIAIAMVASLAAGLVLNSSAAAPTEGFTANYTSTAPRMDGEVDSVYGQIFDMTGKDMDTPEGEEINPLFPLGFNSEDNRYDKAEHPTKESSDWYNCRIRGYAAWDDTYLYLCVVVTNGGTLDDNPGALWSGDSIQIAVYNGGTTDYTFSTFNGTLQANANITNSLSAVQKARYAYGASRVPSGGVYSTGSTSYTYELALEWNALGIDPTETKSFNFNCAINMNDENAVAATFCGIQVTTGIYNNNDPQIKASMAEALKMTLTGGNTGGSTDGGNTGGSTGDGNTSGGNPSGGNTGGGNTGGGNSSGGDNSSGEGDNTTVSEIYTAAEALVSEAEPEIDALRASTEYTDESIDAVLAAYNALVDLLASENPTDEAITEARTAYEEAYAALEPVATTPDDPSTENPEDDLTPGEDDNNDSQEQPSGGSLLWLWIVIAIVVVLAAAAVCVYIFVFKKDFSKVKEFFGNIFGKIFKKK